MRKLPFDKAKLEQIAAEYPTPFHVYDAKAIRENARRLKKAFSWNRGFREYFAVKATPNPEIMKLLKEFDFGSDCSSMAELVLAERVGNTGEAIMFTSNDTPAEEFVKAWDLGAIVNFDDISHWPFFLDALREVGRLPQGPLPEGANPLTSRLFCCRYNPGPLKGGNAIIGKPEEAKYGFTRDQLFECYAAMRDAGVRRFGIHAMVASNELDPDYIVDTARMLFELAGELHAKLGIEFEFVNIGGGIGIPYRPDQRPMDLEAIGRGIERAYDELVSGAGLGSVKLFMECGRCITGPYLYGAYHEIVVPGKENATETSVYDVTGSLCENNDKFAIQRMLPVLERGDLVVICDAGAHGHAMGFQYNGKLRSAELLLEDDGSVRLIRRAETLDDYFATLV